MAKKKEIKEVEVVGKDEQTGNEPKEIIYKYADAVIICNICGEATKIPTLQNVTGSNDSEGNYRPGGISLPSLKTSNKDHFTLSCGRCKSALTLMFVESENPPKEEKKKSEEKEIIVEDSENKE